MGDVVERALSWELEDLCLSHGSVTNNREPEPVPSELEISNFFSNKIKVA